MSAPFCKICQVAGAKWRSPAPALSGWYVCDNCHLRTSAQLMAWVGQALAMVALGRSIEAVTRECCARIEAGEPTPRGGKA